MWIGQHVQSRFWRLLLAFAFTPVLLAIGPLPPGLPKLGVAADCSMPSEDAGGPSTADSRAIAAHIVPALTGNATKSVTIVERMRARKVPGVSVAIMRGGKIAWARGWGVRDAATCQPVTPETAFQAASISKTFAAVLAMREVEHGRLALDTDINRSLARWQLPRDERFPPGTVTLRQLLSHTAGLGVHGFSGYPPGAPLPTLPETLDGKPPANTEAVRLEAKPGAAFSYSGGGYIVVQVALEDTTHIAFADLAARDIFRPLGMSRSSFAQPPTPATLSNAATGHHEGQPFAAKFYVDPELAAAGLWTTPTDLARFLIDVRAASLGETGHLVSPQTAAEMLKPGMGKWGLGFAFFGEKPNQRFGHYGGNWGFLSEMFIEPKTGDGIVVMANGEQGLSLADEIVRSAANQYGWSDLQSRPLADTLRAVPIFLRGSMNDWSTAARLQPGPSGVWQVDVALKPGDCEFKIGSEDWTLAFGIEGGETLSGATKDKVLSSDGGNIPLKIVQPGTYRFTIHADETGVTTLSIARTAG